MTVANQFEKILALKPPDTWQKFAELSDAPNCGNPFGLHAYQFRRAAEELVQVSRVRRGSSLTLPIAYLFRHYIELSLKSAWESCGDVGFDASVIPITHDLKRLWQPLREFCLDQGLFAECDEYVGRFEEILEFLNGLDQKSTTFRYPLADRSTHVVVDVPSLCESIEVCDTVFAGLNAMLSYY